MIELENFPVHLKTIKESDWQKLFAITDKIYKADNFGEHIGFREKEKGVFYAPHFNPTELMIEFVKKAYEINILPGFDWGAWDEGKKILFNKVQDYNSLDTTTLCKLLTTIIRADRFNEGYLSQCFEEKVIEKIIASLKNKIKPQAN